MKFSIIVPVYNVEVYIDDFLQSAINQTFANLEIILVDDGSTDLSGKICDDYKLKDERIIVIHKENGGVTSAWKKGLEHASGDYVGFADPDDILNLNYYQEVNNIIENLNVDIVMVSITTFGISSNIVKKNYNKYCNILLKDDLLKDYKQNMFGNKKNNSMLFYYAKYCKVIRREIVMSNWNWYDEKISYGDDVAISLVNILDAKSIYITDEVLYNYRIRNNSITNSKYLVENIDETINLIDTLINIFEKKQYKNDFALCNESVKWIIVLVCKCLKNGNDCELEFLIDKINSLNIMNFICKSNKKFLTFKRCTFIMLIRKKMKFLLKIISRLGA